jgi:hypothetical protein
MATARISTPVTSARLGAGALLVLFAALGAACTAAGESGSGDPVEVECERGEILVDGECVDPGGRGDTGENPDEDVNEGTDPGVDAGEEGFCEPNERFCVDGNTVGACNDSGTDLARIDCTAIENCVDGECIPAGDGCEPGVTLRCASATSAVVCGSDGQTERIEPCDSATPNCVDGACTDLVCSPGSLSCDGQAVVECSSDGMTRTTTETCDGPCTNGACTDPCAGDGKTYVGCGFYALDLDQFAPPCTNNGDCLGATCVEGGCTGSDDARGQQFAITISNSSATTVEITVTDGAGTAVGSASVPGGDLATISLPTRNVEDSNISFNSFRVDATGPVTVHQFNPANNVGVFSNDASLLLPATSVGTDYVVNSWPTLGSGGSGLKSFVAIVAVAEGITSVTVRTPTATAPGRSGIPAAIPAGGTATFELERGEVLSLTTPAATNEDLSGMEITSTLPISVFAGSECGNVPLDNQYCDHLEEQLFPVDTWGTEYVAAKFSPRGREPDVWRIVAAENSTTITTSPEIAGVHRRTMGRGEVIEFETPIQSGTALNFVISADRPISVAQFMVGSSYPGADNGCDRDPLFGNPRGCVIPGTCDSGSGIGDPSMLIATPTAQFRSDYIVLTPSNYDQDFLTIVVPTGAEVRLDDAVVTVARQAVGPWQILYVPVQPGVHRVESAERFGLYAYGYDCDVSYAYSGGLDLNSLR